MISGRDKEQRVEGEPRCGLRLHSCEGCISPVDLRLLGSAAALGPPDFGS